MKLLLALAFLRVPGILMAEDVGFRLMMAWSESSIELNQPYKLRRSVLLLAIMPGGKITETYTRIRGRRAKRSCFQKGELG